MNGGAGKGDTPRPVDQKRWDENWERVFGKRKLNTMEDHDETGHKQDIRKDTPS